MNTRLTFNQALAMADKVQCLVRVADRYVQITISKEAARNDYAPAVAAYDAELVGTEFEAVDDVSTIWTFIPADQSLLIG